MLDQSILQFSDAEARALVKSRASTRDELHLLRIELRPLRAQLGEQAVRERIAADELARAS